MTIKTKTVLVSLVVATVCSYSAVSVEPAALILNKGPYPSKTPHYLYADTLKEQEEQLKNNPLMKRFEESRQEQASDPYRPTYHFISPEGLMNDALELLFWQGKWHLFYAAHPPELVEDGYSPQHWGHAVSKDLVHWRDLPYAIYPGIESSSFDGGAVVEEDRVIAFYQGLGLGDPYPENPKYKMPGYMAATSRDPLLLNWKKIGPLNIPSERGDSDIWKEGDTYYGLAGGRHQYYPESTFQQESHGMNKDHTTPASWPKTSLWTSKNLQTWEPRGELLFENTPLSDKFDDLACPTFLKIDDKYLLLYFSHMHGGQYFLGDYDKKSNKFRPYDHGRFNHGQVMPGGAHCSAGEVDGKGGVVNIMNINEAMKDSWGRPMSLPQRLTLSDDKRLRIAPVDAVDSLRGQRQSVNETVLPADKEIIFDGIKGNTMELNLEIDPKHSRYVQLNILRSPEAEEQTSITFYNLHTPDGVYLDGRINEEVVLDTSRSSTLSGVWPRSPEKASIRIGNDNLKLRVFIDRSIVEVYVNGQQFLTGRVYPGRKDSLGVSLRAYGQDAALKKLDAWQMKPTWPVASSK